MLAQGLENCGTEAIYTVGASVGRSEYSSTLSDLFSLTEEPRIRHSGFSFCMMIKARNIFDSIDMSRPALT